jgi:hypothetical protein
MGNDEATDWLFPATKSNGSARLGEQWEGKELACGGMEPRSLAGQGLTKGTTCAGIDWLLPEMKSNGVETKCVGKEGQNVVSHRH